MNLVKFAREVHQNAVANGWWEEERTDGIVFDLIHSEWSEALEEYRAGHAAVWSDEDGKPEGWAVKLIYGVIRIADFLGQLGKEECLELLKNVDFPVIENRLPELIIHLHIITNRAYYEMELGCVSYGLIDIIYRVKEYIEKNHMSFDVLLREMLEYNKH